MELALADLLALAASEDLDEVERAHQAALFRMGQEQEARVVAAMAYDRGRALAGREQKFGTQAVLSAGGQKLWPIEPTTTDSERAKWGLGPLASLHAQAVDAPLIGKAPLRKVLRERRQMLDATALACWSKDVAEHGVRVLQPTAACAIVALYWPLPGEVDPRPLALLLAEQCGARLALPVVKGGNMTFREWAATASLEPAGYGTFGPTADAVELTPTMVLAPMLGFDRHGGRLGQGKGYYDRTLLPRDGEHDQLVVGIAGTCQELPMVPTLAHDRRLDMLITEVEATTFAR